MTDFSIEEAKSLCCRASDMVTRFCQREPIKFHHIIENIGQKNKCFDDYYQLVCQLAQQSDDEATFSKQLRQFRLEQHVELACRDVLGQISIERLLENLSDLAMACLESSYHYLYDRLSKRYGVALNSLGQQQHLCIFGMGKLGGRELNFSSDIDLILAYPEKGQTQGDAHGDNCIDNELFFHRLAQKLIRLLDKYDEHGFVYRVDMRLKPFGNVGTLCITFETMKRYYLEHGRNWERYALVKMAVVAGDKTAGRQLIQALSPFIYQRHVDYQAVSSIEQMRTKIISACREKALQDNLKLGYGGIREIEFLVQTFQMMYGGRIQELRTQSLLSALQALQEKGLLGSKVTNMLSTNYLRLRKIENAIQYYSDQQTHDLPNKTEPRKALLSALGIDEWLVLIEEVNRIRFEVFQLFKRIFATQDGNTSQVDNDKLTEDYWLECLYQTDITQQAAQTIANDFVNFYQRIKNHDLAERYLIRLNWVLPQVIAALDGEENPIKIAKHMLELLAVIVDESVYLSLLVEQPTVLKKIMHLFMHSTWMTRFLCQHPRVIDELIHENYEQSDPDGKQIREKLQLTLHQCLKTQDKLQKLVDFKNAMMFATASSDLQKKIRLMHVSDQLTWTAEAIIEIILQISLIEMIEQYGKPRYELDGFLHTAEFGIVAYGKLGGLEMGYHSDLDLVFLHNSQGEKQITDGQRSIDNDVFFTRLVGKLNNYLSTMTASGKLYELDIRLRPSGHSGLLVHSLAAFERYQQNEAWTWEHQALVRARFITGGKTVEKGFNRIRKKIIRQPRDKERLRQDVIAMRHKMRQSQTPVEAGFVHVKHGLGGVTDIEFIVQYLLLAHSREYPQLIRCSDNMRQLAALEVFGVLRSADAADLRSAYRAFRFWIHHCQLLGQRPIAAVEKFQESMPTVQHIWEKTFGKKP